MTTDNLPLEIIVDQLLQLRDDNPRYDSEEMVFEAAEQTIGRSLTTQERDRLTYLLQEKNTTNIYSNPEKYT